MASRALVKVKKTLPWLAVHQFKKGQSGNPNGREKGHKYSLRAVMRAALKSKGYKFAIQRMINLGIDIKDGTHGDLIAAILLYKAEGGDMDAIKEVIRLTERPLTMSLGDGEGEDPLENAINVTINVVKTTNIQNNFKGKKE